MKNIKQEKFIKAYIKHLGNISLACKEVGISRTAFYKWEKKEAFKEKLKEANKTALADKKDYIESKLMLLVEKEDRQAIIHASKTLNRDRGYGDSLEIKGEIEPITIVFDADLKSKD